MTTHRDRVLGKSDLAAREGGGYSAAVLLLAPASGKAQQRRFGSGGGLCESVGFETCDGAYGRYGVARRRRARRVARAEASPAERRAKAEAKPKRAHGARAGSAGGVKSRVSV